jgi:hypothetical protein
MADIATLLVRNLQEIFGEGDDALRRKVAEEIFHEDVVFVEPHGIYRGRDEIVRIAGVIRAMHPSFRYTTTTPVEALHDQAGRVEWVAGAPGEPPAYAGTDFIVAQDGKISAIYLFSTARLFRLALVDGLIGGHAAGPLSVRGNKTAGNSLDCHLGAAPVVSVDGIGCGRLRIVRHPLRSAARSGPHRLKAQSTL